MAIAVSKIERDAGSPPKQVEVPFFRPTIGPDAISEVVECLNSGWLDDLPVATSMWQRLVRLPIFSGITSEEMGHIVNTVRYLCAKHVS